MDEIRTLLEEFWISRDSDREKYYRVKRDVPKFQKFIREQLGWKLIHTEHLIKLEKIPAHAESFMGIQEFTEIQDYCILCAVLMFLEDREEQERFLLSELIDYVETVLKGDLPIDWTSFTQRKSLVRVLQYLEKGFSNVQISEKMNVKLTTVKSHIYNIYKKLGVKTRVQAVQKAREAGML